MGVYIKGLKIPQNGARIFALTSSGMVEDVTGLVVGEAVDVKVPHGRLVDAEELPSFCAMDGLENTRCVLWREIDDASTIIEAEGKDDD